MGGPTSNFFPLQRLVHYRSTHKGRSTNIPLDTPQVPIMGAPHPRSNHSDATPLTPSPSLVHFTYRNLRSNIEPTPSLDLILVGSDFCGVGSFFF